MIIPRRRPYFAKRILFYLKLFLTRQSGDAVETLEKSLAKALRLPNPVVVASGRTGLQLLLETSGLRPQSEIIIPGYTFGLLTKSIQAVGFVPKPVDIDPFTFEMSPEKVEAAVAGKTGAILATHLFGEPCDLLKLKAIAKRHKLLLIEDCAQSLGATTRGKLTGTIGDAGLSSFNISKPLQGIAGGVVFSKDKRWMAKIREKISRFETKPADFSREIFRELIGYFLIQTPFWFLLMYLFSFEFLQKMFVSLYRRGESSKTAPGKSGKSRKLSLPPALAKIVLSNLPSLEKRLKRRRGLRRLYRSLLGKTLNFQRISPQDKGSVYMLIATINGDVFKLRRHLAVHGVDIAIRAEIADDCLKERGSITNFVFDNAIALPVYESLKRSEVVSLARIIKNYQKTNRPTSSRLR